MKYLWLCIFVLFPLAGYSQIGFDDPATVAASVTTHKRAGAAYLGRTTQEGINKLLMDSVKTSSGEYRHISDILDDYEKAFNLADGIVDALASGVQIGIDVSGVAERVADIANLLKEYVSQCEEHGIDPKQMLAIFVTAGTAGTDIQESCEDVYRAVLGLAQPLLNKSLTTSQALDQIDRIGNKVHVLRRKIDRLYKTLYYMIAMRRGYYPSWAHITVRRTDEYSRDALSRWHQAMRNSMTRLNK